LFHPADDLAANTAAIIGSALGVEMRRADEFDEVDLGVWTGLTLEQFETRYESAYHELRDAPLTVRPPDGESMADALQRLRAGIAKRLKRASGPAGILLRPLALALVRHIAGQIGADEIWEAAQQDVPVLVEINYGTSWSRPRRPAA
jgi:broad specificity phosphatase PhoE